MTERSVFGIVVRTIGLLIILGAVKYLYPATLSLVFGGPAAAEGFFFGIPALFVGLWFLGGGRGVMSFAYPEDPCDKA